MGFNEVTGEFGGAKKPGKRVGGGYRCMMMVSEFSQTKSISRKIPFLRLSLWIKSLSMNRIESSNHPILPSTPSFPNFRKIKVRRSGGRYMSHTHRYTTLHIKVIQIHALRKLNKRIKWSLDFCCHLPLTLMKTKLEKNRNRFGNRVAQGGGRSRHL